MTFIDKTFQRITVGSKGGLVSNLNDLKEVKTQKTAYFKHHIQTLLFVIVLRHFLKLSSAGLAITGPTK